MPATGLFLLAVFVGILALVVLGAAWFVAIPLAFLLFLVPVAFFAALGARRSGRAHPTGSEAMPSSREASYDPVVDPAERPRGR
jgi:membrane protein implicated in regulation of membrane protease activity